MKLTDDTIALRALEPDDLDTVYRWENDPALWPWGNTCAPLSRHALKQYIDTYDADIHAARQLRLMIVDAAIGDRRLGTIDLFDYDPVNRRAAVGIFVDDSARRQGVALRALRLTAEYCRERLGMHQLWATVAADNRPSRALFESAGFKIAGRLKSWLRTGRTFNDAYIYQRFLLRAPESAESRERCLNTI